MGQTSSSLQNLKTNPHLMKLASKSNISPDDEKFWNDLLSFTFSSALNSSENNKIIEETVSPLLEQFMQNNMKSRNLASLTKVYVERASQLKNISSQESSGYHAVLPNLVSVQALNSLYVLRFCLKQLVQTLTEENVIQHFTPKVMKDDQQQASLSEPSPAETSGAAVIESLILSLIETIVDVPISHATYLLHVESIATLLILLSIQMFSTRPAQKSTIYKIVMHKKCSIHSVLFTKSLVTNFLKQEPLPKDDGGSLILGLASGFWNVLSFGYGKGPSDDPSRHALLSKMSLLLILVVTNHCTTDSNPYRDALFSCMDCNNEMVGGDSAVTGFKIDFSKLYETICSVPNDDQTTLFLYLLVHKNSSFRDYILSKTSDLDNLVIPILKVLYDCPEKSSHHVYMALILLLILTEDRLFNESVHEITVKNVVWYKEKVISEISLGGLMTLVIIRAIQYNISRTRDKFLHTNLLATLANMSSFFKSLNTYVCQKMVNLFEKISKRFSRKLSMASSNGTGAHETNENQHSDDPETDRMSSSPDLIHDLSIYEEVLRMLLEIINSCLASQLTHNPNLVYTLLYNRHVFESYQSHPAFQDVVINIETVLTYFSNRIAAETGENETLSVPQVYQIIENSSKKWPSEKLKVFAPLKFKYVEDDQPEEFFIPYIWSLVYRSSFINFSSQNILLFNPNKSVV